MQPFALMSEGKRGGIKVRSVVDEWMRHPSRAHIDKVETRSDRPRPTFEENGVTIFNRYWPPAHPKSGGEIETFKAFFAHLFPDGKEREWLWNYFASGRGEERCSISSDSCLARTMSRLARSAS
jgi:hypothetical protein